MESQELVDILSTLQFKQTLSWEVYLIVVAASAFGVFLGAYLKERGKQYATSENFEELKNQLKDTTVVIEQVKSKVSEKTWVNQQIWVKKQEAYEVVFELLFHVKRYVSHQVSEYEEWEYINHRHPYMDNYQYDDGTLLKLWDKEKAEYEEKTNDPKTKEEAEKLKVKYEEALASLFQVIEVKSIYLDEKVGVAIKALKSELSRTDEHEEWDDHSCRITRETKNAIKKIREISMLELKIET